MVGNLIYSYSLIFSSTSHGIRAWLTSVTHRKDKIMLSCQLLTTFTTVWHKPVFLLVLWLNQHHNGTRKPPRPKLSQICSNHFRESFFSQIDLPLILKPPIQVPLDSDHFPMRQWTFGKLPHCFWRDLLCPRPSIIIFSGSCLLPVIWGYFN